MAKILLISFVTAGHSRQKQNAYWAQSDQFVTELGTYSKA